jgi:hypothetical protein
MRDSDGLQCSAASRNQRNCTTDFADGTDEKRPFNPDSESGQSCKDAKTAKTLCAFAALRLCVKKEPGKSQGNDGHGNKNPPIIHGKILAKGRDFAGGQRKNRKEELT